MKKITLILFLLTAFFGFSQNTVTVDVGASWNGYMNVFDNAADPTPDCGGGFCFGSGWAIPDLKTVIGGSDITLQPNYNGYANSLGGTNADRDYWTNSSDGGVTAGPLGNKEMEASTYVEPGASFNGQDLTFTANVVSNSIGGNWTAEYFIKALDPGAGFADALNGAYVLPLPASGVFSVTVTGAELSAGLIIQYGFRIYGINGNPANEIANGSVVVDPVVLSVNEFETSEFKVFPNPSNGDWSVQSNQVIKTIEIYDVLGQRVNAYSPNAIDATINGDQLQTGMYFAKIQGENGSDTIRLIKE
ncbi:MAG: T9SS type A sorting domain-containing protein [Flavobacteriaceae bacterium]|nr:T9SS type A sorting domain-containing protein [Bacteroidia bacterium]MBT8287563.1 T9SS type A sorting domain-containing protein [Bacteroidia bacterium]NNF73784.1 T9SS type A sorting domain-containing protein [Flavobacteriaceae bacterium]NNK71680.1 T9SS type A sorting domain-containing protein [Flavobacteriaceae bacterium]